MRITRLSVLLLVVWPCATIATGEQPEVRFDRDVLPILAAKCFECHGPDASARQAELRLDVKAVLSSKTESGLPVVVAGDADASELIRRITSQDPDKRMPPSDAGESLTADEIQRIRRWVEEGAAWREHWAFVRPRDLRPREVADRSWVRNPIDLFVSQRLAREGLSPSPEADKRTLIRRVTLDLTGLPPTPTEVNAFLANERPEAYERVIARLLDSPRFGERLSIEWLDAARYADTHGYLFDTQRSMWRWRDWVIEALNRNQPFDQFTIEQLAGDLLPNATPPQQIATGFHRNHIINNEAGATPAEYFVENIVDRVNTTATVWLGLSLQCCQCHDHKYDPFTQREYYQLYSFFNNVPEVGLDGLNSNAKPLMPAPTAGDEADLARLAMRTKKAEDAMALLESEVDKSQREWEQTLGGDDVAATEGLLGHWAFDGNPNDGVEPSRPARFEAGDAAYDDGVLGSAATFDGLSYLDGGNRLNFRRDQPFSFAVWVRPSTITGRRTIISRMEDAQRLYRGYALQLVAGAPAFFLVHSFPDNMIQVQAKEILKLNQWRNLAVTYDGSGKAAGVKLYVDGELQKTGVTIDSLSEPVTTDAPFWIGNGHPVAKFIGLLDDVRAFGRALDKPNLDGLPGLSIRPLVAIATDERNEEQTQRIRNHFLKNVASAKLREPFQELVGLREELESRRGAIPTVMVMKELDKARETKVLVRGAFNKPGESVTAATPAVLPSLAQDWPGNRLGLANWLVHPDHPLTARVIVNRYWQMYFGLGLVRTSEDFGIQGEPPSHPELLDWLAMEFVRSGWNVKAMQRLIVTSATYRQSTGLSSLLLQIDLGNRLLARGPRHRLSAELMRDQALAASGLLVGQIGGPSVRPYQPAGLWREVAFDFSGNLSAQIYKQDTGEDLYRRGMYTFWKRTSPPPSMLIFDAPDRERCVVRREPTNTPLQALALMNEKMFVESSRKLAERMMLEGDTAPEVCITHAFELLLAREPTAEELGPLVGLFHQQQARFREDADAAKSLLDVGESKPADSLDPATLAAYTVIANLLFNLDETITTK